MNVPRSLLDEVLPRFDASEVHEVWVAAPPQVVFEAVKQVTVGEVRLLKPLEGMRRTTGPACATPGLPAEPIRAGARSVHDEGVVPLGERPGTEIAAGAVGRFWRLVGNESVEARTREDFLSFKEPGYAKAAISFLVRRERGGSRVITETRVKGTSPRQRVRCSSIGVRSGWGVARFAGVGSPRYAAARLVSGLRTPTRGHV